MIEKIMENPELKKKMDDVIEREFNSRLEELEEFARSTSVVTDSPKGNIDDCIDEVRALYQKCIEDGYHHMASYWGGYMEALQKVKYGIITTKSGKGNSDD